MRFDLAEIDPAAAARGERIAVVGAAEAVDALAEGDAELVDAAELVGEVGLGRTRNAAQPVERLRRRLASGSRSCSFARRTQRR